MSQERPERDSKSLSEVEAIQYTGSNLQAVRGWLGGAYDRTRGGLQDDDPVVVWFDSGRTEYEYSTPGSVHSRVYPGEWLVRQPNGEIKVLSDEDYKIFQGVRVYEVWDDLGQDCLIVNKLEDLGPILAIPHGSKLYERHSGQTLQYDAGKKGWTVISE